MSETVSLDFDLTSPIERVWHALTDPATLSKWVFFEPLDFQPVAGHKFQLRAQAGPGWDGIIDGLRGAGGEPARRRSYTWVGGPSTHVVHTTLTWTLTETQNGGTRTRLHLEQSGFESAAKQAIGEAHYGWQRMLEQLQNLLVSDHRSRGE